MIKKILQWFACKLGSHDWTCAAGENIPPTKEQLEGGIEGFYDYATMYCRHCRVESRLSMEAREYAKSSTINGRKSSDQKHDTTGKH